MRTACVPFPAPGGPKIIKHILKSLPSIFHSLHHNLGSQTIVELPLMRDASSSRRSKSIYARAKHSRSGGVNYEDVSVCRNSDKGARHGYAGL
jgi:hypothetical protein